MNHVCNHVCRTVTACAAVLLLAACGDITRGSEIDHDRLAAFHPGVTTIAEVEQSLGKPLEVTREDGGDTYLKYLYATVRFSKYAQIPVVSQLSRRGHAVSSADTVYLHFGAQGRLLDSQEYTQNFDTRNPDSAAAAGSTTSP